MLDNAYILVGTIVLTLSAIINLLKIVSETKGISKSNCREQLEELYSPLCTLLDREMYYFIREGKTPEFPYTPNFETVDSIKQLLNKKYYLTPPELRKHFNILSSNLESATYASFCKQVYTNYDDSCRRLRYPSTFQREVPLILPISFFSSLGIFAFIIVIGIVAKIVDMDLTAAPWNIIMNTAIVVLFGFMTVMFAFSIHSSIKTDAKQKKEKASSLVSKEK